MSRSLSDPFKEIQDSVSALIHELRLRNGERRILLSGIQAIAEMENSDEAIKMARETLKQVEDFSEYTKKTIQKNPVGRPVLYVECLRDV